MFRSTSRPGRALALTFTTTLSMALGGAVYYRPTSTLTTGPNTGHWGGPTHFLPGKPVTQKQIESQSNFRTSKTNEELIASQDPTVLKLARGVVIGVIATVIEVSDEASVPPFIQQQEHISLLIAPRLARSNHCSYKNRNKVFSSRHFTSH